MLRKVHETIKPRYPNVKIVAGATVPIAHGFLKGIFEQGAMPYLDAVSIHPYTITPDTVAVEISELRELIKAYNNGVEKPIWATEFSRVWSSSDADRYISASYLAQIAIIMLSQNVERMYYYVNMDDGTVPYLGLFSSGGDPLGSFRPHPPLIAYATLIRQLYGATYQDRFNTSKSTYAFRFQRGSEQVIALWVNYYPVVVSLATNSNVVVTNIMGGTETKSPVSGEVRITLSKDVQYVTGSVSAVTEVDNKVVADSLSGYSKIPGENGWYYGYADPTDPYDPSSFQPMTWGIGGGVTIIYGLCPVE